MARAPTSLADLPSNAVRPLGSLSSETLRSWAQAAQHRFMHATLTGIRERRPLLVAIGRALEFPSWFGANLDALYDSLTDLPREAGDTLALIKRGGPFPFHKDGVTFQNREHRLPVKPRGYYTEYTVRTPGRADRGARRIIAGKGTTGSAMSSGEYYYSDDHYETFRRIQE